NTTHHLPSFILQPFRHPSFLKSSGPRGAGFLSLTMDQGGQGDLNWRLSAHPITLLVFLTIRIGALLMYLFGVLFINNFVLVFILTLLLLSADFYYLKNIAGRRLVGLRWWNEVNISSGDSHWVFESSDPNVRTITATDKRFFWLSLYVTPALWVGLAILAILRLVGVIWLSLVGIALVLTITNTVAFSRCDKFSQASTFANRALGGSIVNNIAGGLLGRLFR
ncbi:Golgi apparatus membrane protein tvp23, partial [Penicillium taxi]|uniref:Golgi apparatus membrane protein tvp23 n=1 Tax=Penicillium taxi TaxID=168475 RepID=UPI0025453F41